MNIIDTFIDLWDEISWDSKTLQAIHNPDVLK